MYSKNQILFPNITYYYYVPRPGSLYRYETHLNFRAGWITITGTRNNFIYFMAAIVKIIIIIDFRKTESFELNLYTSC